MPNPILKKYIKGKILISKIGDKITNKIGKSISAKIGEFLRVLYVR